MFHCRSTGTSSCSDCRQSCLWFRVATPWRASCKEVPVVGNSTATPKNPNHQPIAHYLYWWVTSLDMIPRQKMSPFTDLNNFSNKSKPLIIDGIFLANLMSLSNVTDQLYILNVSFIKTNPTYTILQHQQSLGYSLLMGLDGVREYHLQHKRQKWLVWDMKQASNWYVFTLFRMQSCLERDCTRNQWVVLRCSNSSQEKVVHFVVTEVTHSTSNLQVLCACPLALRRAALWVLVGGFACVLCMEKRVCMSIIKKIEHTYTYCNIDII